MIVDTFLCSGWVGNKPGGKFPCVLHAHSWVQVSLLPYPHAAHGKLSLILILLKKLSAEEVFKVTGELSVFQDNLILPICFCKQLLLGCLMPAEEVVLRQVSVCWSKQIQLLFKHFQENQIYYTVRNQDVWVFLHFPYHNPHLTWGAAGSALVTWLTAVRWTLRLIISLFPGFFFFPFLETTWK